MNTTLSAVTRFMRKLRGGSQPILARASDGFLYVVKFSNNLQGSNLLFNEGMGSELYRACGLPVPSWKPLLVTDDFIDGNQACWIETEKGHLRPEAGICFGSRFIGREGVRLFEVLPGNYFDRIQNRDSFWLAWLVDICAGHSDNRQAIFKEEPQGLLNAIFIDHGHIFGGPKGDCDPHFRASRYLDSRAYSKVNLGHHLGLRRLVGALDFDLLWRRAEKLPDKWKTKSALDAFSKCLNRMSSHRLLRNLLDEIETHRRSLTSDQSDDSTQPERHLPFLHPGV